MPSDRGDENLECVEYFNTIFGICSIFLGAYFMRRAFIAAAAAFATPLHVTIRWRFQRFHSRQALHITTIWSLFISATPHATLLEKALLQPRQAILACSTSFFSSAARASAGLLNGAALYCFLVDTEVTLLCRYDVVDQKIKKKTQREVTQLVLSRPSKLCNFIEWKDQKIIFKRCDFYRCSLCTPMQRDSHSLSDMPHCILCVGSIRATMSL